MKYTVVTSFSNAGFEKYGRKFIQTFNQYWPQEVELYIYHEGIMDALFLDHHAYDIFDVPECSHFSRRYHEDTLANGRVIDKPYPWKKKCVDDKYNFRYDAYKFSKKVFAILDVMNKVKEGKLFWVDADIVTFAPVTISFLDNLLSNDCDTCYLGRSNGGHSECGFVGYNLDNTVTWSFIDYFAWVYSSSEVFKYKEWHDSYIYDKVREHMKSILTEYCIPSTGRGHVFINSILGSVMDHLKGDRKDIGRSGSSELKTTHDHMYWSKS